MNVRVVLRGKSDDYGFRDVASIVERNSKLDHSHDWLALKDADGNDIAKFQLQNVVGIIFNINR